VLQELPLTDPMLDKLERTDSLILRPAGGRVSIGNAGPNHLDPCSIELKCWFSSSATSWFGSVIRIGNETHKPLIWTDDGFQIFDEDSEQEETGWNLRDCPVMVSIHRADTDEFSEISADKGSSPIIGGLRYYPPLHSADGFAVQKRPFVALWARFGQKNFELLVERLLTCDEPDFDIAIEVVWPGGSVEPSWIDKKVTWDGNDQLPILNASIIWRRADWSSDSVRYSPANIRPEVQPYQPTREHVELVQSLKRLENGLSTFVVPMWIAAISAAIAAWLSR
jgi:hypothetical protein